MNSPADIVIDLMSETKEETERRRKENKERRALQGLSDLMGDAISDLDNIIESLHPEMDNRKAIDILNDVIRMLNKNKCYESADELDEVRQFLGRDL